MDLISREELINRLVYKARDGIFDEYDSGANDMLEDVIETIREFPSKYKWIPVKERLPEVMYGSNGECSDDVLICVIDDDITISTGFYGYYPDSEKQQGWWSVWCLWLKTKAGK